MAENTAGDSPYEHEVPVRIRDIDFAGHAHHSAALLYFEEARAAYWRDVVQQGGDVADFGFVLAAVSVRYRARILYPDILTVAVGVSTLGRKHFDMTYEVRSRSGALLVTGTTTQVMYDYRAGRSVAIPDVVRVALTQQDGPLHAPPAASP